MLTLGTRISWALGAKSEKKRFTAVTRRCLVMLTNMNAGWLQSVKMSAGSEKWKIKISLLLPSAQISKHNSIFSFLSPGVHEIRVASENRNSHSSYPALIINHSVSMTKHVRVVAVNQNPRKSPGAKCERRVTTVRSLKMSLIHPTYPALMPRSLNRHRTDSSPGSERYPRPGARGAREVSVLRDPPTPRSPPLRPPPCRGRKQPMGGVSGTPAPKNLGGVGLTLSVS